MKNKMILLLIPFVLACVTPTAATIANTPAVKSPPATEARQMIVIAEVGLQVRKDCGIHNPTTGIILTNGVKVTIKGAAVKVNGEWWQPIEGGCVNADYLK